MVVLFDGRCGLCRGSRRWAERLDWAGSATWLNFRDPAVRAALPQLSDAELEEQMWVISADGKMRSGFAAWRELMSSFPLTCLPGILLYLPLVPRVGEATYLAVARRRRLSCELSPAEPITPGPWREILDRARPQTAALLPATGKEPV